MTLVQGELKLVTDNPEVVSQVWLRAPKERLHGTGMVTTGRDFEPVVDGIVSFTALPGPVVMVLLANGIPTSTVKLLVPDKANATLRECIEAVGLADDGTISALEELALEVARVAATVSDTMANSAEMIRDEVKDDANRAESAANLAEGYRDDAQSTFDSLFGQGGEIKESFLPDRVDLKIKSSQSTAALGPELITSSGWTLGAGWSGDATSGFTHTAGDTSVLEWDASHLPAGNYIVSFQASSAIAAVQNLDVTLGNSDAPYTYGFAGAIQAGMVTTTPGVLRFAPVSGTPWSGTLTDLSVREVVGAAPASMTWVDDQDQGAVRVRVGHAAQRNIFMGDVAGQSNVTGPANVAIGHSSMGTNTTGAWNVALGWEALRDNTSGTRNVALGMRTLVSNTTGYRNIAVGQSSMVLNTTGQGNISMGADSMLTNTSGNQNIAIGLIALGANKTGSRNIAIGYSAMNNADTSANVALGAHALYASTGALNVALGDQAARYTKAGSHITVVGSSAGFNNVNGSDNTSIGFEAGRGRSFGTADFNRVVAVGKGAGRRLGTGHDDNTLIGYQALAYADGGVGNTVIGMNAGLSAVGNVLNRNVLIGNQAGGFLKTGADENTVIGTRAGLDLTTGRNNVLIGYNVQTSSPTASNEINIGNVIKGSNAPGLFEVSIEGKLRVANIPQQDPQSAGQVWNDNGTLKVSAG